MVNNIEISEGMIALLKDNEEINNYCLNTFNKKLILFLGIDISNPPEKFDMPCITFEPIIKEISDKNSEFTYEFYMIVAIVGDEKPRIEDNVIYYDGIYKIEELGNLICKALQDGMDCNSNLDLYEVNFYHNTLQTFPVYTGSIVFRFSVPNVIGNQQIKIWRKENGKS